APCALAVGSVGGDRRCGVCGSAGLVVERKVGAGRLGARTGRAATAGRLASLSQGCWARRETHPAVGQRWPPDPACACPCRRRSNRCRCDPTTGLACLGARADQDRTVEAAHARRPSEPTLADGREGETGSLTVCGARRQTPLPDRRPPP